jgi:hypothetical protein
LDEVFPVRLVRVAPQALFLHRREEFHRELRYRIKSMRCRRRSRNCSGNCSNCEANSKQAREDVVDLVLEVLEDPADREDPAGLALGDRRGRDEDRSKVQSFSDQMDSLSIRSMAFPPDFRLSAVVAGISLQNFSASPPGIATTDQH